MDEIDEGVVGVMQTKFVIILLFTQLNERWSRYLKWVIRIVGSKFHYVGNEQTVQNFQLEIIFIACFLCWVQEKL